jgi:hypothetical protein
MGEGEVGITNKEVVIPSLSPPFCKSRHRNPMEHTVQYQNTQGIEERIYRRGRNVAIYKNSKLKGK